MLTRRNSREWAVQMVFELEHNPLGNTSISEFFRYFWEESNRIPEPDGDQITTENRATIRAFAERLVIGVVQNSAEIDARIQARIPNWRLERIGAVERAVLRVATFEIYSEVESAPDAVVINEAIDLAKFFSENKAGRFVNGILDNIARHHREERNRANAWSPIEVAEIPPDAPNTVLDRSE